MASRLLARQNKIDTPQSIALFAVGFLFTITASLSVVLRLWAKRIIKNKIVTEDYLCIIGLITVVVQFIFIILEIQLGSIGHELAPEDLLRALQIDLGYRLFCCLAVALVKLSIVSFYIRIFGVIRRYRIMGYCLVAFIIAWLVMSVLLVFFACFPFELTWDPMAPIKDCSNQAGLALTTAALDLVADIGVFVIPLWPISKLQVNNGKKLVLFFIFGLGFSTIIIAGLRIEGFHQFNPMAFQTTSVHLMIYDILEPAIGISVACMPLLQPLIRNTWLGNKLGIRGADRVPQIPMPDSGAKRLHVGDNELGSFGGSDITISAGRDTVYDHESSETLHTNHMQGITKTETIIVDHGKA